MTRLSTIAIALTLACTCAGAEELVPHRLTFDSLDVNPVTGKPVRIESLIFRPAESWLRKQPAVVVLHGCGGLYSSVKSRQGKLSLRHQAMAELLVAEGYVVLFPDSFGARGVKEICTVPNRSRTIGQAQRLLDAQGALQYLQVRTDVIRDRVAVLGWSNGGSTVLAAINSNLPAVAAWNDREGKPPYFRAAAAFYPGCMEQRYARVGYGLAAPLILFVAGSDDWTAPRPCVELAERLLLGDAPVDLTVYRDTYHGFDAPSAQKALRLDVPNGVHPGQGVTVAPNPEARADAYAQLRKFLRQWLGEPVQAVGSHRPP